MPRKRRRCDAGHGTGPRFPQPLVFLQSLSGLPLKVATDCSGLETPLLTLAYCLKVFFVPNFGSDSMRAAQRISATHFQPQKFFKDISGRDNNMLKHCYLYIAGFPCQTFTPAGLLGGLQDLRGILMVVGLASVELKRPDIVIWENTSFLVVHFPHILEEAISLLKKKIGYWVQWEIVDTFDHGLPQRRKRIYLVAIKKLCNSYNFPPALPYRILLSTIITPLPPAEWLSLPPQSQPLRR